MLEEVALCSRDFAIKGDREESSVCPHQRWFTHTNQRPLCNKNGATTRDTSQSKGYSRSLEIPQKIFNLKQKTALWDASSEAKFALPIAGLNDHSLDRACVKVEKNRLIKCVLCYSLKFTHSMQVPLLLIANGMSSLPSEKTLSQCNSL